MLAPAPLALTDPQVAVLRLVHASKRVGVLQAAGDPVYMALARRGLIMSASFHDRRSCWRATIAGRRWVRDDQERNGGGPKPAPVLWTGTAATNTRWTLEQALTLAQSGVDPAGSVATATVLREAEGEEDDWTLPPPRRVRIVVPRLAITRDGRRAKIVTPSGSVLWLEIVRG